MKKFACFPLCKIVFLFLISSLPFFLGSCGKTTIILSPPEWIQGTWQSESTGENEYIIWVFTADNGVYEYHDPANGIHSTIDLQSDSTNKWIRDEIDEDSYEILIDRHTHGFYPQADETTGLIDDPTILDYTSPGVFNSGSWELVKQ